MRVADMGAGVCLLQPPIRVYGAAGRYASALYSASSQAQTLEKTQQDLQDVRVLPRVHSHPISLVL